jgi:diguanylate cyclase (GGDEF)-like protein
VESARLFCSDLLITLHRDFIVRAATDEDFRNVVDKIDSYFSRKTDVISSVSKIYTVVDSGYTWAKAICHEDSKKYIHKIYEYFYKRLSLDVVSDYKLLQDKQLYLNHMNNLVIRDTLMFEGSLKESYAQILKKLHCLDINTSYLYILDEPVKYQEGEVFPTDMKWNFKSYMYGANIYPVPDDEQKITAHEIFENKYLACERRHTLVVADLYSTEYQYGIALCEPRTTDFFYQLEMVTYQLSAAVKIIELLKGQEKMLTELHRTNLSLENMSKIDELTGIFNRRGFYSAANNLIASDRARGKQLVVCYGDMDSLKGVNDNYGHLEGDFALKSLAEIMVKVFGEKSIVARMGGDEYAAVALAEDVGDPEEIKRRRDEYEDTLNESAGKPYHIGISIGLYQCVCDNSYDLREAIDKADDLLYIEKAKRRRV